MSDTVYVVYVNKGYYDENSHSPIAAFRSREAADDYEGRCSQELERKKARPDFENRLAVIEFYVQSVSLHWQGGEMELDVYELA